MSAQVNKPTNVKEKEADVNRKLQLYGMFTAFQAGKVPSVRIPQILLVLQSKSGNASHEFELLLVLAGSQPALLFDLSSGRPQSPSHQC